MMTISPAADFLKYLITPAAYSTGDQSPFSVTLGGAIISPNLTGIYNRYEGQVTINFNEC